MTRAELLDQALHLYASAVSLIEPVRLRAWSKLSLTMPALKLLFVLRVEGGAPSGVLAERLGVTPSTISGLVDRLERQQLVRRAEDTKDRRVVRNYLTDDGVRMVSDLERQSRSLMSAIMTELDDDQLHRLVHSLGDLMNAAHRCATIATVPV